MKHIQALKLLTDTDLWNRYFLKIDLKTDVIHIISVCYGHKKYQFLKMT